MSEVEKLEDLKQVFCPTCLAPVRVEFRCGFYIGAFCDCPAPANDLTQPKEATP